MATITLSQALDRTKADHTADDFTVGQLVKAHPATGLAGGDEGHQGQAPNPRLAPIPILTSRTARQN